MLSMEAESGDKDQVKKYVDAAREMGIEILPPDINESNMGFRAVPEGIRIGLFSINGLGAKILESIVANRPYESFDDFVTRAKPNKTAAVNLIKAGAFDRFEPNRNRLLGHYFETYRPKDKDVPEIPKGFTTEQKRAYEAEVLGFVLSLSNWEKTKDGARVSVTGSIKDVRVLKDKKERDMAFVDLATKDGLRDVVVFAREYEKYGSLLNAGARVKVQGKKDGNKVICNRLAPTV